MSYVFISHEKMKSKKEKCKDQYWVCREIFKIIEPTLIITLKSQVVDSSEIDWIDGYKIRPMNLILFLFFIHIDVDNKRFPVKFNQNSLLIKASHYTVTTVFRVELRMLYPLVI